MIQRVYLSFGSFEAARQRYLLLAGNVVSNTAQEMLYKINHTLWHQGYVEAMQFEIMKVDFAKQFEDSITAAKVVNEYEQQVQQVVQHISVLQSENQAAIANISAGAEAKAKEIKAAARRDAFNLKQGMKAQKYAELRKALELSPSQMGEYFKVKSVQGQSSQGKVVVGLPSVGKSSMKDHSEIMSNAASSINVLTERDQVKPPSSGFHLSLFANYTLDGIKAVLVVSIDTETGATNAAWDRHTATALAHPAFQPFTWPLLRDTSASYTDVKVYNGNEILFHWIFRGYRADTDLTVQQQFVDEVLVREANRGKPRLSIVVASFMGWRVTVFSFECGGRTYSVGPNGAVVAGDHARSRFELRVCSRSSPDAMGNDADRVEFRFRDANNRLDLKCARTSVPGTWLTVSHISGPALIQTIQNVRQARARVEGPEHTEQFAQLAAVHQAWRENAVASTAQEVGSITDFIGDLEKGNFHITCTSKLWVAVPEVVNQRALAEMQHEGMGRVAPIGPPALTGAAWGHAAAEANSSREASVAGLSTQAQADYELSRRALNKAEVWSTGHEPDDERDQARLDRRYARSSAAVTPGVFAAQISQKRFNETTATIEELDLPPADLELPHPAPAKSPTVVPVFTRYCVWLENQSCGPAVIPALTYAVRGLQEVGDGSARCEVTSGLLSVEVFAMLGDTADKAKDSIRTMIPEATLGGSPAERDLSVMQLAAVWLACQALQTQFASRRARMEEDPTKVPEMAQEDHAEFRARFVRTHPDVILIDAREPHKKFVEKLNRDFLVQGMVPFYTLAEVRTRADTIVQKSGLTKNAEDLLTIARAEEPDSVTDVSTLFNRIHALFMALEYLNICQYSRNAGPLDYLQQLEQFRQDCPGLPYVMAADSAIRKKVFRLQAEQREAFNSYSAALREVLTNHKYLWNDARTKAALSKPEVRKEAESQSDKVEHVDKSAASPSKKKRKRQIERLREQLKQSSAKGAKGNAGAMWLWPGLGVLILANGAVAKMVMGIADGEDFQLVSTFCFKFPAAVPGQLAPSGHVGLMSAMSAAQAIRATRGWLHSTTSVAAWASEMPEAAAALRGQNLVYFNGAFSPPTCAHAHIAATICNDAEVSALWMAERNYGGPH
eukprot:g29336.t1